MAETDIPINKGSMGEAPTMDPSASHFGRRFATGDVILGRYVVESELGQGGMGVVYKCHDQIGGVKVAVKGLPPDVAHNEGEMEEIRANFQLVCDLRHENIAGVRTLEKDAVGDYYLVMDLAHGEDLGTWMRKNKDADMKARLSIVRQIAAALDYAHRRKVMHRDIKPGNIMVSPSGRVLLLDFGLAAQISTSLSRTSHMVVSQSGTPAYKSPEQWRGRPQGAAADQYALAVVAYRLLSGRLPFDGDNVFMLCRAVLEEKPPAIKWLSSYANKTLARALAKDPRARFPNCTAFADALEGKSTAGSFLRLLFVSLLSAGAVLAAGGVWLHFEKERKEKEAQAAIERVRKELAAQAAEAARRAKEAAAREAAEQAQREQAAREAAEQAQREQAAREAAEQAQREQAAREAAAKAQREQAAREAATKAQKEQAAREAAEQAQREQAAREAAEQAQREQAALNQPPQLKIIATLDGQEVFGAKLKTMNGEFELPYVWDEQRNSRLVKGKTLEYEIIYSKNGNAYSGKLKVTVDWNGLQTITVPLYKGMGNVRPRPKGIGNWAF